jgi:uncharacterized SAM-binding protein YcdF (DUF218 family)
MFFFLSKLLDVAVDPLWWSVSCAVAGLALLARGSPRRRLGLALVGSGAGLLLLFSTPAVANRLWHALEAGARDTRRPGVTYDAVVLLGGVVQPMGSLRDEPAWNDHIERLLEVRELLLSGRARLAIVSGGQLGRPLRAEAEYLADELTRLGVPRERLVVEANANNTRENATESKKLLDQLGARTVLLVTSAFHAPRSLGCFTAVGIQADLLPVDFRVRDPADDHHLAPRGEYLALSTRALREWLGRLVYAAMGYSR